MLVARYLSCSTVACAWHTACAYASCTRLIKAVQAVAPLCFKPARIDEGCPSRSALEFSVGTHPLKTHWC